MTFYKKSSPFGIYVHFPYCIQKCSYCDFFSTPIQLLTDADLERYVSALRSEFALRAGGFDGGRATSLYFGGGTASLLPPETVQELVALFGSRFDLTDAEITLEGNPEHFTPEYLREIHTVGINRINVGIQSFSAAALEAVNRHFNPERYGAILDDLATSPIRNFGCDLIYGLPGQDQDGFFTDLRRIIDSGARHLSLYALSVEQNTLLATRIARREIGAPDEALQTEILEALPEFLAPFGFRQYEVSNFALPGYECRHNIGYWEYRPYLAVGPGAHGFDGRMRYENPRSTAAWLASPGETKPTPADPIREVPLGFFRMTRPLRIGDFLELLASSLERDVSPLSPTLDNLFREWEAKGWIRYGRIDGTDHRNSVPTHDETERSFQWTTDGLSFLDDHIFEIVETIERALEAESSSEKR